MKKITFTIVLFLVLSFIISPVIASDNYMINPFYAISSSQEYKDVKGIMGEDSNHMYFQWARLAPNEKGMIEFTNKYKSGISEFDNRQLEYGVPLNSVKGYVNKVDFTTELPKNKTFLSVFFENYLYDNGTKSSEIEFLNMTEKQWDELIIKPMRYMLYGMYDGTYNQQFEFDGLVLDFEGFRNEFDNENYTEEEKRNLREKYSKFLQHLKDSLGKKELIVCVHPNNVEGYYDGYDYEFISNIADNIILMAYNYYDADVYQITDEYSKEIIEASNDTIYESIYGYETQPYAKVRIAVDDMINKYNVESKKLILGLDIGGMKWIKLTKRIEDEEYVYSILRRPYLSGIEEAVNVEGTYIPQTKTYKKVLTGDNILNKDRNEFETENVSIDKVEYYYETPESFKEKYYSILKEYDIAGLSVWRLGTGSIGAWEGLTEIHYNDEFDLRDIEEDVPSNREFRVKLDMPLDQYTINSENIYMTDNNGSRKDIIVELITEEDEEVILVKPINDYQKGMTYNLYITKGVKYVTGEDLEKGIRVRFVIENN